MGKVVVVDHPMIQHKLSFMRSKEADVKEFREMLEEISMLMGYEVLRDMPLEDKEIETPICRPKSLPGARRPSCPFCGRALAW